MFMTDMQSLLQDEEAVLATLQTHAVRKQQHTTVIGIGVDLSVGTVETLSCTPGCMVVVPMVCTPGCIAAVAVALRVPRVYYCGCV